MSLPCTWDRERESSAIGGGCDRALGIFNGRSTISIITRSPQMPGKNRCNCHVALVVTQATIAEMADLRSKSN